MDQGRTPKHISQARSLPTPHAPLNIKRLYAHIYLYISLFLSISRVTNCSPPVGLSSKTEHRTPAKPHHIVNRFAPLGRLSGVVLLPFFCKKSPIHGSIGSPKACPQARDIFINESPFGG